jgi:HTH-type transcriptional regulator / antitoxin HigA
MNEIVTSEAFEPDWAVPPGATIAAILASRSLSRETFAENLGESVDTVQRLLLGLETVNDELAERLSRCLGASRAFWINRQAQYQSDVERIRQQVASTSLENWVKQFPTREMAELGWISAIRSPVEVAVECLKFFGVHDVASWQVRYGGAAAAASFRMATSVRTNPGTVIAWLRWAELVAERIPCGHWNSAAFRERLQEVKRLTWQKNPKTFLSKLRNLCAEVGVAVVIARTPKGCPASGATRFLSPTKALMVLSFRYRSDDQFWFTFFHESAHLLLHGHNELFLEDGSDVTAGEETEANEFAKTTLVPEEHMDEFLSLSPDEASVLRFARRVGVSPGLIVGQLQHSGQIGHDRLNWLKRRFTWNEIEADRLIP